MERNPHLEGTVDEFFRINMKLASFVAWPFIEAVRSNPANSFDKDDILSIAYMGLTKAYKKFDPTKYDVMFSTYAVPVIKGEILRHLRDFSPMIRAGREVMALKSILRKAGVSSGSPVEVMMEKAGLTEEEANTIVKSNKLSLIDSLDRPLDTEDGTLTFADTLSLKHLDDDESLIINDFVSHLDPRLKTLYQLRIVEGKSQQEAGKTLKLSQVQTGRLEGQLYEYARQYGSEQGMTQMSINKAKEAKMSRKYPEECRDRAKQLAKTDMKAGQIVKVIQEEFSSIGIPPASIFNWINKARRELGLPGPERSRKYSVEAEERAKQLIREGRSSNEVFNVLRVEFPEDSVPISSIYVWNSKVKAEDTEIRPEAIESKTVGKPRESTEVDALNLVIRREGFNLKAAMEDLLRIAELTKNMPEYDISLQFVKEVV